MRDLWRSTCLGDAVQQEVARVGLGAAPVVLSSTKHHGLVPSDSYFKGRQIYSDDISAYRIVKPGWFAYATNHLAEGSIGLNQLDETGCVSPMYTVFSVRRHVDQNYLYSLLKSPEVMNQYRIHEQASVDRRGSIRFNAFSEISIRLPPLAEQRRIAEILNTLDETIRATEHVIAKHERIRSGLASDLLTRKASCPEPTAPLRGSGVPSEFTTLGDLAQLNPESLGSGTPQDHTFTYIDLSSVSYGSINESSLQEFSFASAPSRARRVVRTGDVLFGTVRPQLRSHASVTHDGDVASTGFCVVRPEPTSACSRFIHHYLLSDEVAAQAARREVGSNYPAVTERDVAEFKLRRISLEEQRRIAEILDTADETIRANEEQLRKLQRLRSGLADDLLSGRVRTVDQ